VFQKGSGPFSAGRKCAEEFEFQGKTGTAPPAWRPARILLAAGNSILESLEVE